MYLDEEFVEKVAGIGDFFKSFGRDTGTALRGGALATIGATAVTGLGLAAKNIYGAATKSRDFRRMMEFNPDLQEHHERDPKMFNQMFSSLRSTNANFASDPLIAGSVMRNMALGGQAGSVLHAISEKTRPNEYFMGVMQAGAQGVGPSGWKSLNEADKWRHEAVQKDELHQHLLEKAKNEPGYMKNRDLREAELQKGNLAQAEQHVRDNIIAGSKHGIEAAALRLRAAMEKDRTEAELGSLRRVNEKQQLQDDIKTRENRGQPDPWGPVERDR